MFLYINFNINKFLTFLQPLRLILCGLDWRNILNLFIKNLPQGGEKRRKNSAKK